ncbi:hypothetical protein SLEP1_g33055 [Rubroshorea leprosula]|uniref:Uncharacterized protein n=1 Tax=Rubroshorea leprosula TaxID=152421 RepID=A0AAV5KFH3_9ROSI|nr:hypothetical protein SLEP1_g33055 [Rubroshorea leprosula]
MMLHVFQSSVFLHLLLSSIMQWYMGLGKRGLMGSKTQPTEGDPTNPKRGSINGTTV